MMNVRVIHEGLCTFLNVSMALWGNLVHKRWGGGVNFDPEYCFSRLLKH